MFENEDEKKKREEEARNIISSLNPQNSNGSAINFVNYSNDNNYKINVNNEDEQSYIDKINEANSIINSINPREEGEIPEPTEEEREESRKNTQELLNLIDNGIEETIDTKQQEQVNQFNITSDTRINGTKTKEEIEKQVRQASIQGAITENKQNNQSSNNLIDKDVKIGLASTDETANAQELTTLDVKAMNEANQKNKNIEKGGLSKFEETIDTVLDNIYGGVKQTVSGLANILTSAVAFGIRGLEGATKIIGLDEQAQTLNNAYNSIVDLGSSINETATYEQNINSQVNDNLIQTAGEVTNTISNMVSSTVIGYALPANISSTTVMGLSAGGNAAQEVLDENKDNIGQATLTGIAKGYSSYLTEKMFDANILTRGEKKSSIQEGINRLIANNITSKFGKEFANSTVGIIGENIEEIVDNNAGYLIDKLVNNKDLPDFKQWLNEQSETIKTTTLSTMIMSLLGLGGTSFKEIEGDMNAEYWIDQAQQIIDQENLAIHFNPNEVKNINDTNDFYITRFTPDGEIANIVPTKGKTIYNSKSELNVSPVIILDSETNMYNVIDGNTGVVLDSTPYPTTMEAEGGFNEKINKLSDLQIKDINTKISKADYMITNEIMNVVTQAQEQLSQMTKIDYKINKSQDTNNTQTSAKQNTDNFSSNTTNYAIQNIDRVVEPFSSQERYTRDEMAEIWNNEISNNNYDAYYDNNGNIERYIAIEEDGKNIVVNQYDNNDNIVRSAIITSDNGRYNSDDIRDTILRVSSNIDLSPYIQEMATNFQDDLANTLPGKRYKTGDTWNGQKRSTTKELADIKDETGVSWNKIGEVLDDIANARHNNTKLARTIEQKLDEALSEGYTNIYGKVVNPNEEYLEQKSQVYGRDFNTQTSDDYDPTENMIDEDFRVFGMKKKTKSSKNIDINKFIKNFDKAKNNIDRETVVNIADSLDIKIKEGATKIEDTNMSKLAGKNKTPQIITIDELFKDLTSKNIKEYRKEAESIANNLYRDKVVKIYDTQTNTEINKSGIEKTLSGNITKSKIQSINKLQDIIEQGIYGYTTYNPDDNNGILYHHFFTPVNYQNKNGLIRVVIREFTNDNSLNDKYYYHQLEFISNKKIEGINALPQINGNKEIKFLPSTKNSIPQNNQTVKNITMKNKENNTSNTKSMKQNTNKITDSEGKILTKQQQEYFKNSKVRDGNGNLQVVYHGTNNFGFTEFNRNVNYYTSREDVANTYTGNNGIYRGYLDIKNPIVIDANKEKWSMIDIDNIKISEIDNVREFLHNQGASVWQEKGKTRTTTADIVQAISDAIDEGQLNADGIIIQNIYDEGSYSNGEAKLGTDYITFKSNQFKNLDNSSPTSNSDIRYMKKNTSRNNTTQTNTAVDNQGRTLSKQQQEYFKNSKVRDDNGKLLTVYHGSSNQFTIFDQNRAGKSTKDASIGFWFTETREGADNFNRGAWYGNDNSNVYEVYLDIKNPKIYRSIDNSSELEQIDNRLKENRQRLRDIENKNFTIEVNSSDIRWASDESELNDIAEAYGVPDNQRSNFVTQAKEYQNLLKEQYNLEKEYENKRYNDAYEQFRNDIYKVAGKTPSDANIGGTGMYIENYSEVIKQYKQNLIDEGYDGIIIEGTRYDSEYFGRNNNQYVAFYANQIKNIDNTNPTSNKDIRFAKKTVKPVDEVLEPGQRNAERDTNYIEQEIRKIEQTGNWDDSIPVTKMTDIRKTIEDYLGIGVQKGRFRQQAYGIYKGTRDVIRTKELKDIDTILHETGHALDIGNRIKINKEAISNELLKAVNNYGGYETETREIQLEEGFAEVIREYTIVPEQARIDYPQTVSILEGIRQENKDFDNFIRNVQEQTYNYIHQNPRNRTLSNVSIGEQTDKRIWTKASTTEAIMRAVYDKDWSLKSAVNELQKVQGKTTQDLRASENAYYLTRLSSGVGGKITSMLSNGYIDENGNKLMPGLNQLGEILGNEPSRFDDLRAYLVAQRDLEYKAKTLKTGIRTMDSKAVVAQFKNDTQIQEASKLVYDTLDGVMQYAVNNGLITQENADSLRESNVFYVPMQRVLEGNKNNVGRRGAVVDVIKARTGSELDVKDVLENIVSNSANIIQQVENNNILKALYKQGEQAGITGKIYDVISTPMVKVGTAKLSTWESELKNQGVDITDVDFDKTIDLFAPNNKIDSKNLITSFINDDGKRVYLQFNDDVLFNSLMNIDRKFMSTVLNINRKFNMPLRYGATMANIGFAIPNVISDTAQASIFSDAGFIPVVDNLIGVMDIVSAQNREAREFFNKIMPGYADRINTMYALYEQSGATSSTRMSQYRESTQVLMKDVYGTKNSEVLGIKEKYKPLKRLLDIMTYIPDISEQSTRFRIFEKNLEYYRRNGIKEMDARIQSALQSRDATQDFGRTGNITREINQLIPFSAARVGSAYTFAEKVKANPKRTVMRLSILTAVAMAIKTIGYDDDEIEELNQRKKNDNFVLKIGDEIVTIKKPQGILRSIVNLTEYIQDLFTGHIEEGKEGERLAELVQSAIMDNMPADSVTGLVPNMVAPVVENAINKDLYYNSDIVKSYDLELPDSEQYYDYNSQLAIWLGQIFNYSPAKIDNLISGYFAGLGTSVTNVIDWISGKIGITAEQPEMGAEDNAVAKRFIVNVNSNSASVDEVYDLKTELTKKKNGDTITSEESQKLEDVTNATSEMAKLNKQIKEIKKDLTISGKEKADQIKLLQQQKVDTARKALGKDVLYSENETNIESTTFYPSRDILSQNGYTLNLTSDMKKEYEELAYNKYKEYENQGLYSEEKLESLREKCKDYAKSQLLKKYKNDLIKKSE